MKHRGSYYSELWMGATASSSPVSVTHRVATDTLKTEDSSQLSLSQQYLCIVYSYIHHICIYIYGWWFGTWNFHILAMSSSQLTFIFFRGVGIPPTSCVASLAPPSKFWSVTTTSMGCCACSLTSVSPNMRYPVCTKKSPCEWFKIMTLWFQSFVIIKPICFSYGPKYQL